MDNSYFVYTNTPITIERFHICTWEFSNNKTLVEFGCEIVSGTIPVSDALEVKFFIPWLDSSATVTDLYPRLKDTSNSRFIFNDSISNVTSLDGGGNKNGVIHQFSEKKNELCILPLEFNNDFANQKAKVKVDLRLYNQHVAQSNTSKPNIYFRFYIIPAKAKISVIKKGITKSTMLYDIKLNQRRNIPDNLLNEILHNVLCKVETCFCFNIIPNTHELAFIDSSTLKNVRTLESKSFKEYLGDEILQEDLIVVFNKKSELDSYTFFSIFTKERIGIDQLTVALLINLVAGILLFMASLEVSLTLANRTFSSISLPILFWIVIVLFVGMLFYYLIKSENLNFTGKKKA